MPLNSSRYSPASTVQAAGPTVRTAVDLSANAANGMGAAISGSVQVSGVIVLVVIVLTVVMARALGGA